MEIKILRAHNELMRDKYHLGERVQEMGVEVADLKADLQEQKMMCEEATRTKQQIQADAAATMSASGTLEKQASDNTRMLKHLLKTKQDLEAQIRERNSLNISLEANELEKESKKGDKAAKK